MARVTQDHGKQRCQDARGRIYIAHVFVLDCGCTVKIDERVIYNVMRASLIDMIDGVARAHNCDVVVERGEIRPRLYEDKYEELRRSTEARYASDVMRYTGMDVKMPPLTAGYDPWSEPPKPVPKMPPLVGFKVPDPPKPEAKQEPVKLDRFHLIEMD